MNCPLCGELTQWLVGKYNCQHCGWVGKRNIDPKELHEQVKRELSELRNEKHETKPTTENGDCNGGACRGL